MNNAEADNKTATAFHCCTYATDRLPALNLPEASMPLRQAACGATRPLQN